jgi:hypothetical protein
MRNTETTQEPTVNIINGDTIEIREENYSADGIVVGIEVGPNWEGVETTFVLANFGNETLGRIPLTNGTLPKTHTLRKTL